MKELQKIDGCKCARDLLVFQKKIRNFCRKLCLKTPKRTRWGFGLHVKIIQVWNGIQSSQPPTIQSQV